jgi:hypothetical protein
MGVTLTGARGGAAPDAAPAAAAEGGRISGVVVYMRGEAKVKDVGFGGREIIARAMCGALRGQGPPRPQLNVSVRS